MSQQHVTARHKTLSANEAGVVFFDFLYSVFQSIYVPLIDVEGFRDTILRDLISQHTACDEHFRYFHYDRNDNPPFAQRGHTLQSQHIDRMKREKVYSVKGFWKTPYSDQHSFEKLQENLAMGFIDEDYSITLLESVAIPKLGSDETNDACINFIYGLVNDRNSHYSVSFGILQGKIEHEDFDIYVDSGKMPTYIERTIKDNAESSPLQPIDFLSVTCHLHER